MYKKGKEFLDDDKLSDKFVEGDRIKVKQQKKFIE